MDVSRIKANENAKYNEELGITTFISPCRIQRQEALEQQTAALYGQIP
jgi:hypothetical protein